jgi:hypothetical protein
MSKQQLNSKRILFVLNSLEGGGIKTSFVNLISHLSTSYKCMIDVLVFKDDKNSYKILQSYNVNIKNSNMLLRAYSYSFKDKDLNIGTRFLMALIKLSYFLIGKKRFFNFLLKFTFKNLNSNYDFAVSYVNDIWKNNRILHYNGCNDYVLNGVSSKFKVSWIHNDPEKLGFNSRIVNKEYSKFSHIVNVSKHCESVFLSMKPELRARSIVLYNVLNFNFISPTDINKLNPNKVILISSSRILIQQKRIDRVIEVSTLLLARGIFNFKWIVIGSGPLLDFFRAKVNLLKLDEFIFFQGKVNNPLDFYQKADFFIQTSDYEAHSLSLLEAKFSKLTLIVMNYPGASEVVSNNDGYLVSISNDSLATKLEEVLHRPLRFRETYNLDSLIIAQKPDIDKIFSFFHIKSDL